MSELVGLENPTPFDSTDTATRTIPMSQTVSSDQSSPPAQNPISQCVSDMVSNHAGTITFLLPVVASLAIYIFTNWYWYTLRTGVPDNFFASRAIGLIAVILISHRTPRISLHQLQRSAFIAATNLSIHMCCFRLWHWFPTINEFLFAAEDVCDEFTSSVILATSFALAAGTYKSWKMVFQESRLGKKLLRYIEKEATRKESNVDGDILTVLKT